ncbi:MAG: alanine racemase [Candidatus Omnitrophota bacterium]
MNIVQRVDIGYRPTWAEIDLGHLAYNYRQVKKLVGSDVKIMACVKADAYGHGIIPVASKLVASGVNYLSVASIDEAITLRQAKIFAPILVLGMVLKKDIEPLFRYNISQTVCSEELAVALNAMAKRKGKLLNIHVKVDTGMGRIGVLHHEAFHFIKRLEKLKNINIEGVATHLSCADVNRNFTIYQLDIFERLVDDLCKSGTRIPLFHAANSVGVALYENSHFNMVRPGLMLYGLYPRDNIRIPLKPVMSLKTRVVYVKRVPKGWGISYGHAYVTEKETYIATLPIGYGDGYPRNLSNAAPVIINNKLMKINGMVCMDQVMIDVGSYPVRVGDEVILIGSHGKNKISTEQLAKLSGTIPYEIACGLGSRVPRVYV